MFVFHFLNLLTVSPSVCFPNFIFCLLYNIFSETKRTKYILLIPVLYGLLFYRKKISLIQDTCILESQVCFSWSVKRYNLLTACLTVYVGCYRSVKPTPPTVSYISNAFLAGKTFCPCRFLFNHFWYISGDDVQWTRHAVSIGWECNASVTVFTFQISIKRLGQCCINMLLFCTWDCCTSVSFSIWTILISYLVYTSFKGLFDIIFLIFLSMNFVGQHYYLQLNDFCLIHGMIMSLHCVSHISGVCIHQDRFISDLIYLYSNNK